MSQTPCTDICSWNHCTCLQGWSQEAGCTVSAFKPSSVVGCFHGIFMVLCSILSASSKEKSKLKKRVLVVAVCDLIYTTGGWNVTVLLKLKTDPLQWVMANSHWKKNNTNYSNREIESESGMQRVQGLTWLGMSDTGDRYDIVFIMRHHQKPWKFSTRGLGQLFSTHG